MKLSIIVPVYNVEKYIEKCLNSLCNLETENEIIIVNDGSTDSSLKIVEEFKKNHDNENIIIISQENKGLSEARNTGLRKAKGEYVSFIDSDDFVDKKLYEMMIKEVIKDKVDYGIGKYSYCYENTDKKQYNDNEIKEIIGKFQSNPLKKGKEWLKILKKEDKYGPEVWDDIYKREFLVKNNLFFKPDRLHEDEIFTLEVFLKAEKVKYYAIPFYCYLQRENSIMKTQKVKNFTDMQKNIFDMEKLLSEEKNDKAIQKILIEGIHRFYKIIIKKSKIYPDENKKFIEDYKVFLKKYRENRIKNMFLRLKKSIKKKFRKLNSGK